MLLLPTAYILAHSTGEAVLGMLSGGGKSLHDRRAPPRSRRAPKNSKPLHQHSTYNNAANQMVSVPHCDFHLTPVSDSNTVQQPAATGAAGGCCESGRHCVHNEIGWRVNVVVSFPLFFRRV